MFTILLRNSIPYVRQYPSGRFNCTHRLSLSGSACRGQSQSPQLSPYDVNLILRENEYEHVFLENDSTIFSYESNQLGSNKPCEDTRTEANFVHKNGFLCGIYDGHAGPACSQVISKRLLRYIAASVIDRQILRDSLATGCTSQSFLKCHNDKVDFVKEVKEIYEQSFSKFAQQISSGTHIDHVAAVENAFLCLDEDLSREALEHNNNMRTMSVAMSGAVACVAHIENLDVHVASTGDCSAVLGSLCPESGQWQLKKLTNEHNTDNPKELKRIFEQHPEKEHDTVIRNERLLGQLAPLRALGDFRYKWTTDIMRKYVVPNFGEHAVPPHYYTPPYLTALPEVHHHLLGPNDKFMVIASDGLWDLLTPSQVVSLVGEHLASKKTLEPLKLPRTEDVSLEQISNILGKRKDGRSRKSLDQNSATHLIRYALGGTDYGIEHSKISYYLTLPQDVVRLYRDDITITVVYFNTDYIKKCTNSKN